MKKFSNRIDEKRYHFSEIETEDNQAWVRNRLTPIVNFFSMLDDDLSNEDLLKIIKTEKQKALSMLDVIKKAIDEYED